MSPSVHFWNDGRDTFAPQATTQAQTGPWLVSIQGPGHIPLLLSNKASPLASVAGSPGIELCTVSLHGAPPRSLDVALLINTTGNDTGGSRPAWISGHSCGLETLASSELANCSTNSWFLQDISLLGSNRLGSSHSGLAP